mgnify:CR=1 FL=1
MGKSADWWEENAPKFMPEKNSRPIDDLEKDVWLGIIIKELIDEGYKVVKAWKAVCFQCPLLETFFQIPHCPMLTSILALLS